MLAIQKSKNEAEKCAINLLPCKVNYDGPVNASNRYWKPEVEQDGKQTAYFRGRKLQGRQVKIPEGYRGAVLRTTDNVLQDTEKTTKSRYFADGDEDEDEDEETSVETKITEELATFDEVVVWGHEMLPEAADDPYTKGLEEWMAFAGAMHSTSDTSAGAADSTSKSQ